MKTKTKKLFGAIVLISILVFAVGSIMFSSDEDKDKDDGEYDYCISWEGLGGTLHRDNLLFTCYSLMTSTFFCDYEIMENNQLMIKPILNITKNDEGFITEIIYDDPNYFNCTRWLKSKEIK